MCGISGIYNYSENTGINPAVLEDMLKVIEHRGPDEKGLYYEDGLALGMCRLSIIDLAGGQQPIYSEDGRIVVVYNGEIYNYKELRSRLEAQGHVFATECDTEVLVHLYEQYGFACVDELRGMFAFAIWDKQERSLFLARDRLGIKPLYYTVVNGAVVFSSEIKSILEHPDVSAAPDLEGLSHFISLKYVPSPHTMFKDILVLPPGYALKCTSDGVKIWSYWDILFHPHEKPPHSEAECIEQLDALLHESVKAHLMSDVPFGAFLSGGVDSSTVVAFMSQYLNEPVKTFSVGYSGPGAEYSELPYARLVAQQYQTDHHEVLVTAQDFIDLTPKVIWHLDQPIADQAAVATYMVAELASRHVKMVLTGEGGDELFAGYARYTGNRFAPLFGMIPGPIKSLIHTSSARLPGLRRIKLALYALSHSDEVTRLINWFPLFNTDMKAALLSDYIKDNVRDLSSRTIFARQLKRTDAVHWLHRMLYIDTKLWLPDDLLARGDKMTMAASIEGRVPLLDHKVVEFATSLPPSMKLRGMKRKYLLKEVSRKYLPASIIDRKKAGFPMPVAVWFRSEARDFVRDTLSRSALQNRGIFDVDFVERLLDEHETGFADHATLIWGLLNVELWYEMFIDTHVKSRIQQ